MRKPLLDKLWIRTQLKRICSLIWASPSVFKLSRMKKEKRKSKGTYLQRNTCCPLKMHSDHLTSSIWQEVLWISFQFPLNDFCESVMISIYNWLFLWSPTSLLKSKFNSIITIIAVVPHLVHIILALRKKDRPVFEENLRRTWRNVCMYVCVCVFI